MVYSLEELGFLGEESDGVVVSVEVSGEFAHEHISDNHVLERLGEVLSHDAHDALGVAELLNLQDVVSGGEVVGSSIKSEGNIGEVFNASAVLRDGDSFDEGVDDGAGSHDERSSRVDGCHVASSINGGLAFLLESGQLEVPVSLLNDVVGSDLLVSLRDVAGHVHE